MDCSGLTKQDMDLLQRSDLFQGCPMSRSARLFDDQWEQKYIQCSY